MDDDHDQTRYQFDLGFVALSVVVMLVTLVLEWGPSAGPGEGGAALVLGLAALAALLSVAARRRASGHSRVIALALMLVFNIGFWVVFVGLGERVVAVASEAPGLALDLSPGRLVAVSVASLLVLAPALSWLWAGLARYGLEPRPPAKFALGFVLLALACLSLACGIEWGRGQGTVALGGLVSCLVMLALAGLCVGPVGLAAVSVLSPRGMAAPCLAAWLLSCMFARSLAIWLGLGLGPSTSASVMTTATLGPLFELCVGLGLGAVGTALALAFLWRSLAQLSGGWRLEPAGCGVEVRRRSSTLSASARRPLPAQ